MITIRRGILGFLLAVVSLGAHAETFAEYLATCKSELKFNSIPNMNCADGALFDARVMSPVNDWIGHARADNDDVDVVFACRWFFPENVDKHVQSIELTVHNRENGNTCFFKAKDDPEKKIVSPLIVSPTSTSASSYWQDPATLDRTTRCVDCHVAGPYIASPLAGPYMAKFGLLNDRHDTRNTTYHAVGSTFSQWDGIVRSNSTPSCASGCHSVASNTPPSIIAGGTILIRSISRVITEITNAGLMPANNAPLNDYRWVNMDSPKNNSHGDTGDNETFVGLKQLFPKLSCSNPAYIEARSVDSDLTFNSVTDEYTDKLERFNLRDGLVCRDADQINGKACNDYATSYMCNGTWTDWYNADMNVSDGDHEERANVPGLCASPTAIRAIFSPYPRNNRILNGPNDRLAEFDTGGLRCNSADQGSGQTCSNYAVRFVCDGTTNAPAPVPPAYKLLRTQHQDGYAQDRYTYLTVSAAGFLPVGIDNEYFHSGWTGQQWVIERVTDFANFSGLAALGNVEKSNAVRLKSVWNGRYLTIATANSGSSSSPSYALKSSALLSNPYSGTQLWIKESMGDGSFRFGSASSETGKMYVTLQTSANQDKGTQSVLAKPLNTALSTQKWIPE
jgi:hypothetical protein